MAGRVAYRPPRRVRHAVMSWRPSRRDGRLPPRHVGHATSFTMSDARVRTDGTHSASQSQTSITGHFSLRLLARRAR